MHYSDLEKAVVEEAKEEAPVPVLCGTLDNEIARLDAAISKLLSRMKPAIQDETPHTKAPEAAPIPVVPRLPGDSPLAKKLQDNIRSIRQLIEGLQRITGRIEL